MERVTTREDGSIRVQTVNDEPERTKQSFKDECDINRIMRQFQQTGVVRHLNEARAQYADVSELTDYADALSVVRRAEEMFMSLPSKVRRVFNDDPAAFLDAAHDPAKRDQLVEAGLIPAERPQDVVIAPVEPPAVPEA